jgi:hypothetical protein
MRGIANMNTSLHHSWVRLETDHLVLSFDSINGSLVSLFSKVSNWNILNRPHLGLSWRLMLPLEGRRNNNAWGHLQEKPPTCIVGDQSIKFVWDGIHSEFGGQHDLVVTTQCVLENGQAVFKMNIINRSKVIVENVYYPYLGDMHRPVGCEKFDFKHGFYMDFMTYPLYPTFPNPLGTHSVDYPTMSVEGQANLPMNPFGLAMDERGNGLYIGVAERRMEAVTWHAEYQPGWRNSNAFEVFTDDIFQGKDVFTRFAIGHLPFLAPGNEMDLLSFGIEAFKGDWSVGADHYTKMSSKWNTPPHPLPSWAREPHSWLQVQINSPEDELRTMFRDLPERIGRECRHYGVKALQLVGWNEGGQDRGNPTHSPDPRLGTWDELKNAIRAIQEMGVKVILFAKFNWADESRDDFEERYEPLATKDPYGNYYVYNGYQYMTLSQLTNINTRRLIPMCFGSDEYLEICKREFQKCIDLGADGILYDECQHHGSTLCCFDSQHGHRVGASSYRWDERLNTAFREMVKDKKEFLIAGEAIYDFQYDYYDLSYGRTWGSKHIPLSRYLRPQGSVMTAVIGFEDRCMINQCLMNRYIISYEPLNFKGNLSDFPLTVDYGQKMDQLRNDLRGYFWDGQFCAKQGGDVLLENGSLYSSYAVYRSVNGKQGMIICNDSKEAIKVRPILNDGVELKQYRLVDHSQLENFQEWVTLPPESAAAVIE